MKTSNVRFVPIVGMVVMLLVADAWATCGGGGGGGTGGMGGGSNSMGSDIVYQVPWKNIHLEDPLPKGGLVVYWFPASQNELEKSSLRNSRTLSIYATQCVTLGVSPSESPLGQKLLVDEKLPIAVLADTDGKIIGKAQGDKDGMLRVAQVEKMVDSEVKQRENAVKDAVKTAKDSAKRGEKDEAIAKYKSVLDQRCLFPRQAKDAAGELKKLGVAESSQFPDPPNPDPVLGARIEKSLQQGLMAENMAKYPEAERLYSAANRMDPADPVPLRYLGELYRHETGDWDKARAVFNAILNMPADPLSRAVALHGLGKMTIHDGEFKKGLALMEDSAREFPLALTYRNLAVYWHSEGDLARAGEYTEKALDLDPTDPFNVVFAAAFMAGSGRGDEALKIAKANEGLLCASYNLAAIYAQIGQKDRALALLKRHFFEYERYQSVRSKEMMEARVDAVFASILHDPEFVSMTADADGKLAMPQR
jgi:tetratricopeptide (TPR) repeat protein